VANLSGEGRPSSGQRVVHHQRGLHGVSRCRIAISTVWRGPSSRCWRGLEGRQSLHHLHHAPFPPPVALAGPVAHRKQLEVHSDVAQSSRDAKKTQLSPAQTGCSSRPSRAHGFVKGIIRHADLPRAFRDAEFQEKSYQQSQYVSQFLRGPTALTTTPR
jgi:hypothetical protein